MWLIPFSKRISSFITIPIPNQNQPESLWKAWFSVFTYNIVIIDDCIKSKIVIYLLQNIIFIRYTLLQRKSTKMMFVALYTVKQVYNRNINFAAEVLEGVENNGMVLFNLEHTFSSQKMHASNSLQYSDFSRALQKFDRVLRVQYNQCISCYQCWTFDHSVHTSIYTNKIGH